MRITKSDLNDRELATVLASLRYWQREGWRSGGCEHDVATNGGELKPLSVEEIDTLCARLNIKPPADEPIGAIAPDGTRIDQWDERLRAAGCTPVYKWKDMP